MHSLLFLFFVVVSVLNPVQLSVYIDLSKGRVFEEGVYITYLCVWYDINEGFLFVWILMTETNRLYLKEQVYCSTYECIS